MTPANDNRPAGFDAALVAYLPTLRKRALFITKHPDAAEELLSDTVTMMLHRASECRMETFKTWATMIMRGAAFEVSRRKGRLKNTGMPVSIESITWLAVAADQDSKADLSVAIDHLSKIRHGELLLRNAGGELLTEIAGDDGTSRENVRQKVERARKSLRKVMKWAA